MAGKCISYSAIIVLSYQYTFFGIHENVPANITFVQYHLNGLVTVLVYGRNYVVYPVNFFVAGGKYIRKSLQNEALFCLTN